MSMQSVCGGSEVRVGRQACKDCAVMTWQQSWHLDRKIPVSLEAGGEDEGSRRRFAQGGWW